jgi:hypothetical protein
MLDRMQALSAQVDSDGYDSNGWKSENGHRVYNPAHDRDNGRGLFTTPASSLGSPSTSGYSKAHTFHTLKDDETFTCDSVEVSGKCPIANVPNIYIAEHLWNLFIDLAAAVDTEWMVLLYGKQEEEGNYVLGQFYFPPQTVSPTSVDIPTGVVPKAGVIAALHSHVQMNAFFSGTDKDHSNWPVEIVLNARGNYEAICRHKLECGRYAKSESKVMLTDTMTKGKKVRLSAKLTVLASYVAALERAIVQGIRLERGNGAQPDDSPEPETEVARQAQRVGEVAEAVVGRPNWTMGQTGTVEQQGGYGTSGTRGHATTCTCPACTWGRTEHIPDDGSAAHDEPAATISKCPECGGIGLVDEFSQLGMGRRLQLSAISAMAGAI